MHLCVFMYFFCSILCFQEKKIAMGTSTPSPPPPPPPSGPQAHPDHSRTPLAPLEAPSSPPVPLLHEASQEQRVGPSRTARTPSPCRRRSQACTPNTSTPSRQRIERTHRRAASLRSVHPRPGSSTQMLNSQSILLPLHCSRLLYMYGSILLHTEKCTQLGPRS